MPALAILAAMKASAEQMQQPLQRIVLLIQPTHEQTPPRTRTTRKQTPTQVSAMGTPVKTWRYLTKLRQRRMQEWTQERLELTRQPLQRIVLLIQTPPVQMHRLQLTTDAPT
jgi:hypothetical protein